jgi:hypothetical protein
MLIKLAWLALELIHLVPAAPSGDLAVIVAHRGLLFCAVVVSCVFGAFEPVVRRPLGIIVGMSVLGFLILYVRAGMPRRAAANCEPSRSCIMPPHAA